MKGFKYAIETSVSSGTEMGGSIRAYLSLSISKETCLST